MKEPFLFEIGTEELPHGFIDAAERQLAEKTEALLRSARISFESIKTFSTPRRLAVLVTGMPARQDDLAEERKGPPLKAAFKNGSITKAGEGFIRSGGYHYSGGVDDLVEFPENSEKTESLNGVYKRYFKNQYFLFSYKYIEGIKVSEFLKTALPEFVRNFDFPKKMRWGNFDFSFARPIRWLIVMIGQSVIPVRIAGVVSDQYTYGHLRKETVRVENPLEYEKLLYQKKVIASSSRRRQVILDQLEALEKNHQIMIKEKKRLISVVSNLTEWPFVILADFDKNFLDLPEEVLTSEMVEHQMYFPVYGDDGNLKPQFVITSNIEKSEHVRRGNLKVLTARLRDGAFLYESDLKRGLGSMGHQLTQVLFQKDLGSMAEKVSRIAAVAEVLYDLLPSHFIQGGSLERFKTVELARLMKNDLVSEMVGEFPKLQGVMGAYYAVQEGFSSTEASAFKEQYMPLASGTAIPESGYGVICSIADKIDNIFGCFAAGLIPDGSGDPYALRRQAQGLVRIFLEKKIFLSWAKLFDMVRGLYEPFVLKTGSFGSYSGFQKSVFDFVKGRMKTVLKDLSFSAEEVQAATASGFTDIYKIFLAVRAVSRYRRRETWELFSNVFKRVSHITRDVSVSEQETISLELLRDPEEKRLYEIWKKTEPLLMKYKQEADFENFFDLYGTLSKPLSSFFDNVMVECDDIKTRNNRKKLLKFIFSITENILDFYQILN